jgi:choline dehydrogenase-like flavoprotein
MLEGIFTPPGPLIASLPGVGHVLKDLAARYRHLSAFGVMASDTTRGRVFRNLPGCPPLIYYSLNARDAATIKYGVARLTEVYLAAGAKRVYTGNCRVPTVDSAASLAEFESVEAVPDDYDVMAFHPVGTCRMGLDPSKSVVGPDLGVHGVSGLYVMDASVIPDSLGVNPQITIMALALRGGRRLAESL